MPGGIEQGMCYLNSKLSFTPEHVIMSYCQGMFPLGYNGGVYWENPPERSFIPLEDLHISSRMRSYVRKNLFDIRFNTAFRAVLDGCADRENTWLTEEIKDVYEELHRLGFSHSVEAWQNGQLVGGGFSFAIGGFCTIESMFYKVSQASKVAFVHLAKRYQENGYKILDCQYKSSHWAQFGAITLPREVFYKQLVVALALRPEFNPVTIPVVESI
jgi:leucyl/phenylalanyl-tRNA--protein transferase